MLRGLDERATGLDGHFEDRLDGRPLGFEFHLAAADAGNVHQVVHEARHLADLALHHVAGGPGLDAIGSELKDLEACPDGGERVSQLVGEGGEEFVLPLVLIAQRIVEPGVFQTHRGGGSELGEHGFVLWSEIPILLV